MTTILTMQHVADMVNADPHLGQKEIFIPHRGKSGYNRCKFVDTFGSGSSPAYFLYAEDEVGTPSDTVHQLFPESFGQRLKEAVEARLVLAEEHGFDDNIFNILKACADELRRQETGGRG